MNMKLSILIGFKRVGCAGTLLIHLPTHNRLMMGTRYTRNYYLFYTSSVVDCIINFQLLNRIRGGGKGRAPPLVTIRKIAKLDRKPDIGPENHVLKTDAVR